MNDKTRREFLKSCFRIGGYAGIACLGMGAVEDARGWGILPAVVSSGAETTWATWLETNEAGWGDSGVYIITPFDGGAAANETGQGGGLTGADLVASQDGGVPGSVGGWRALNGTSMQFTLTQVCVDSLIANVNKTWTILMHVNNYVQVDIDVFFNFRGGSSAEQIMLRDSGGKLYLDTTQDSVGDNDISVNDIPTGNNEFWVGCWADGTNFITGGMTPIGSGSGAAGQPTKLSDFAANNQVILDVNKGDFSGEAFNDGNILFNGVSTSRWMDIDVKTVVIANSCLIDNAS